MPIKRFTLLAYDSRILLALLSVVSFVSGHNVCGQVILDSEGFEAPYSATLNGGEIAGQDALLPNLGIRRNWLTAGGTLGAAVVQDAMVFSGTQALRVSRPAFDDLRRGVIIDDAPSNRFMHVEWDMYVDSAAGAAGPLFGIEVYGDLNSISLLGSLFVDANSGDVIYQQAGSGFIRDTGTQASLDDWNRYALTLDFEEFLYTVSLNGMPLVTESFVDGAFTHISDIDISALAAGSTNQLQGKEGTAWFDNLVAYHTPEPSSLLLSVIAFSVLASRRSTERSISKPKGPV